MAVRSRLGLLFCGVLTAVAPGCGGDDDDASPAGGSVEGEYTAAITNRTNGCGFDDWSEGESTSGIRLSVTEDDGDVRGEVTGQGAALVLTIVLGADGNVLEGTASGGQVELERLGTTAFHEGNCTYTLNATLTGTVDGDVIQGSIRYTAATNDNPDCAALEGCTSRQDFNGTRPPT
ncbi:MAG: hypothetical protein JW940_17640 [Polyangiaceae bacterium]|nr:hypothetical protein [Polyangiaceae bacterium]